MLSPYIPIKTLIIKMKIKICEIIKKKPGGNLFLLIGG